MNENRNLLLAIVLSAAVLAGWQYFVAGPSMRAQQARQAEIQRRNQANTHGTPQTPAAAPSVPVLSRGQALERGGTRIRIDTPSVEGSFLLRGGRIDDLRLKQYRETVDPKSPEIILLSPQGTAYPYYAQFGWVAQSGSKVAVPDDSTPWTQEGSGPLSPEHPVTLTWDNGHGLKFTRRIAIDDKYMFTVTDSVANASP